MCPCAGSDKHRTYPIGRHLLEAAFFCFSRCARAMKTFVVPFRACACGNVVMQCVGDASGCIQRLRLRRVRFDVLLTCFCFQWKPQWKPKKLSEIERCLCLQLQWKPNGSLNGSPNGSRENSAFVNILCVVKKICCYIILYSFKRAQKCSDLLSFLGFHWGFH